MSDNIADYVAAGFESEVQLPLRSWKPCAAHKTFSLPLVDQEFRGLTSQLVASVSAFTAGARACIHACSHACMLLFGPCVGSSTSFSCAGSSVALPTSDAGAFAKALFDVLKALGAVSSCVSLVALLQFHGSQLPGCLRSCLNWSVPRLQRSRTRRFSRPVRRDSTAPKPLASSFWVREFVRSQAGPCLPCLVSSAEFLISELQACRMIAAAAAKKAGAGQSFTCELLILLMLVFC